MMNGNSVFGARYSYAADIGSFSSSLVSCSECEAGIKSNPDFLLNKKQCHKCLRWDMMQDTNMTLSDPLTNYPSEMLPIDGKLRPMKLSFKKLRNVVECCTLKMIAGEWSEANIKAYAGTKGSNAHGSDKII